MPKKKIYESPDGGKTVYERDFDAPHSERTLVVNSNSEQVVAVTGRDLMLKSAFQEEIQNIEARLQMKQFFHPSPETIIDYLKLRIKEINSMKNSNL